MSLRKFKASISINSFILLTDMEILFDSDV